VSPLRRVSTFLAFNGKKGHSLRLLRHLSRGKASRQLDPYERLLYLGLANRLIQGVPLFLSKLSQRIPAKVPLKPIGRR
jgi:hypothetical protein